MYWGEPPRQLTMSRRQEALKAEIRTYTSGPEKFGMPLMSLTAAIVAGAAKKKLTLASAMTTPTDRTSGSRHPLTKPGSFTARHTASAAAGR
jgi:hypothetical protein